METISVDPACRNDYVDLHYTEKKMTENFSEIEGAYTRFLIDKKVKSGSEKTKEIVDKHLDALNLTFDDIKLRVASPIDTSAFVRDKK
jgi:hypothetical protein